MNPGPMPPGYGGQPPQPYAQPPQAYGQMPQAYAQPQGPTPKDESDLNLLSTLHYVWSALIGCSTIGIVGYFVLVGGVLGMGAASGGADAGGAAVATGFMIVMGVVMGLMMAALFVVHILAASGLRKRNRRVLTFIASALMCTSVPLGTALGVWTFMVLSRPGVKALYGA